MSLKHIFNIDHIACLNSYKWGPCFPAYHIWLRWVFKLPNRRFLTSIIFFFFFSKVKKVKYLSHLLINHHNVFSESSLGIYLSNFNPNTRRTSTTSYRWRLTKKVRATHNVIKDKMTIAVYFCCKYKKVQKEVTRSFSEKNVIFGVLQF